MPGELLAGTALVHHDDKCCLKATCVLKGLRVNLRCSDCGWLQNVLIVEDIIDTGNTMLKFLPLIKEHEPKVVKVAR